MLDPFTAAADALGALGDRQRVALESCGRGLSAWRKGEIGVERFAVALLDLAMRETAAALELQARLAEAYGCAGAAAFGVRLNPKRVVTPVGTAASRKVAARRRTSGDGRSP